VVDEYVCLCVGVCGCVWNGAETKILKGCSSMLAALRLVGCVGECSQQLLHKQQPSASHVHWDSRHHGVMLYYSRCCESCPSYVCLMHT
jgi:hypothetical protein